MNALYHLKAIAEIVQHYYPETLHRLFIVNAPSAFVVMFKVIKPWLNPRVRHPPLPFLFKNTLKKVC